MQYNSNQKTRRVFKYDLVYNSEKLEESMPTNWMFRKRFQRSYTSDRQWNNVDTYNSRHDVCIVLPIEMRVESRILIWSGNGILIPSHFTHYIVKTNLTSSHTPLTWDRCIISTSCLRFPCTYFVIEISSISSLRLSVFSSTINLIVSGMTYM